MQVKLDFELDATSTPIMFDRWRRWQLWKQRKGESAKLTWEDFWYDVMLLGMYTIDQALKTKG